MKEFVIATPFLNTVELENTTIKNNEFIILACDGLWDVLNDQDAIDMVRRFVVQQESAKNCLQGNEEEEEKERKKRKKCYKKDETAAQMLCNEALKRGSTDNITVIVVWL